MKQTAVKAWSATMTVGKLRGYHGKKISEEELRDSIAEFQRNSSILTSANCAVKIVDSEVIFEDYREECWDITVINYPRFPLKESCLESFIVDLCEWLLLKLEQNRITICLPNKHIMLESETAEESA